MTTRRIVFEGLWSDPLQDTVLFREYPDMKALKKLVDMFDTPEVLAAFGDKDPEDVQAQCTGLRGYLSEAIKGNGCVHVTYGRSRFMERYGESVRFRGRLMPQFGLGQSSVSMTTMSKVFRKHVAGERLIDIDMVNAHPVLLLGYVARAAAAGLLWVTSKGERVCAERCPDDGRPLKPERDLPLLYSYVHDRDVMLKRLSGERKKAKVMVLKVIYGGAPDHELLQELSDELFGILLDLIYMQDPALYNMIDKHVGQGKAYNNVRGRMLSYFAQTLENQALFHTVQFLTQRWDDCVEALCYDGLLVRRERLPPSVEMKGLLEECGRYVSSRMGLPQGYELKFDHKPMESPLNLEQLCEMKGMRVYHDEFVDSKTVYEGLLRSGRLGLWAGLGVGKTTGVCGAISLLKRNRDHLRVLWLSVRQIQARNFLPRLRKDVSCLPWTLYLDGTRKMLNDVQAAESYGIICSFESIWKVRGVPFDLIVVDESEGVACASVSEATNRRLSDNHTTFSCLLREAKWVVGMDAYLSSNSQLLLGYETVLRWTSIRQERHLDLIPVPWRKEKRGPALVQFIRSMRQALDRGRVYAFFTNKTMLNDVRRTLLSERPELRIAVYTGDETHSTLLDVDTEWANVDIVLTTSTVTVGVDCSLRFEKVFVWGSHMSCVVRDIFQSINRVRIVNDPLIEWFYLWDEGMGASSETIQGFIRRDEAYRKFYRAFLERHGEVQPLMECAQEIFYNTVHEHLLMRKDLVGEITRFAHCTYGLGCRVVKKVADDDDDDEENDPKLVQQAEQIPVLTELGYPTDQEYRLLQRSPPTLARSLLMTVYRYRKRVPVALWSQETWEWWLRTRDASYQVRAWDLWPQYNKLPSSSLPKSRNPDGKRRDATYLFGVVQGFLQLIGVKAEDVYRGFSIDRARLSARLGEQQRKYYGERMNLKWESTRQYGKGTDFQRQKQFVSAVLKHVFGLEVVAGKRTRERVNGVRVDATPLIVPSHPLGDAFAKSWMTDDFVQSEWRRHEWVRRSEEYDDER